MSAVNYSILQHFIKIITQPWLSGACVQRINIHRFFSESGFIQVMVTEGQQSVLEVTVADKA